MQLPRPFLAACAVELERRNQRAVFRAEDLAFPLQLGFIRDPNRWKVACCSRRAGKTVACAILLLERALERAESVNLYVTLSRVSGKRIVWRELMKLNRVYALGGVPNRTELSIQFPNGSTIIVAGAKDENEIEKFRGSAYYTVVIDEAQSFRGYLSDLVDDVFMPALIDHKGQLVLIGTPGRVRDGYFYDAVRFASPEHLEALNAEPPSNDNGDDDEEREAVGWSVHHWTIRDNPHIKDVDAELASIRRRKRWTSDHPTYQREYIGRWVTEHDALVFKYDPGRNAYDDAPDITGPEWKVVLAVDQGFNDADVIAVLAWRPGKPGIWYLDETAVRGQGAAALAELSRKYWERYRGRAVRPVQWDTGGGGRKVAEDAMRIHGVAVEAAEKKDKLAGIELVNDLLRAGVLMVPRNSQLASDFTRVTWDPRARGVKISEKYHSDATDVVTYGARAVPARAVPWLPAVDPANDPVPSRIEQARADRAQRVKARVQAPERKDWVNRSIRKARANTLLR